MPQSNVCVQFQTPFLAQYGKSRILDFVLREVNGALYLYTPADYTRPLRLHEENQNWEIIDTNTGYTWNCQATANPIDCVWVPSDAANQLDTVISIDCDNKC